VGSAHRSGTARWSEVAGEYGGCSGPITLPWLTPGVTESGLGVSESGLGVSESGLGVPEKGLELSVRGRRAEVKAFGTARRKEESRG
jgi:hypothetical protein